MNSSMPSVNIWHVKNLWVTSDDKDMSCLSARKLSIYKVYMSRPAAIILC